MYTVRAFQLLCLAREELLTGLGVGGINREVDLCERGRCIGSDVCRTRMLYHELSGYELVVSMYLKSIYKECLVALPILGRVPTGAATMV